MPSALIVVDVQNDFCPPSGSLAVTDGHQVIPKINLMSSRFPIVAYTGDWHPKNHISFYSRHEGRSGNPEMFKEYDLGDGRKQVLWPDHCIQESKGAEFHPDLKVIENTDSVKIIKILKGTDVEVDSYSAFCDNDGMTTTGLGSQLKELSVDRIVVVGLAFDYCVGFTALDAKKDIPEAEVIVIKKASRGVASESSDVMEKRLVEADVVVLEDIHEIPEGR